MSPKTLSYPTPRLKGQALRILSVMALVFSVLATGVTPALGAPAVTTGGPFSYTEQDPPVAIGDGISISGGAGYDGQWVDFEIADATSDEHLSFAEVGTPSADDGVVTIVGGEVYLGDGSTAEAIGVVDPVYDGQNGTKLRVNFTSPFTNPGFENPDDGELGWTSMEQWIDLGVTEIAGFTTQDTSTYPSGDPGGLSFPWTDPNEDNDEPFSPTFVVETTTDGEPTEGTTALRLWSSLQTAGGCDVVHGPAVYSDEFNASNGDSIYFDWRAFAGSDAYHVFGYIIDESGNQTEVLDAYTHDTNGSTNWATKETVIPSDGTYRFVFVAGTFDATCGQAAGAQLLIDNVQVFGNKVDDSAVQALGWGLQYENTSDDPDTVRTVTVTARDADGETGSDDITINITPVDDAPTVDDTSITYTNTAADDDFTDSTGTISASDPENDAISFALSGSVASDDSDYTEMVAGEYGTLYVDGNDGDYAYVPDDDAINPLQTAASESFNVEIDANGLTDSGIFTVDIDVPATVPGAPTGLGATAGDGEVDLNWNAPSWTPGSAVSDYVIQYSSDGGGSWSTFTDGTSTDTSTTVTGLTNGTEYDFRVLAVNDTGTSDPSNVDQATPKAAQAPLVVSAGNFVYGSTTALSTTGGSGGGAVAYTVVSGPCLIEAGELVATGAGTCEVQADKAGDDAYHSVTSSTVEVEVAQKELTVSGTVVEDKVHDGTTDASLTGATLIGVIDGDNVALANHTTGTFATAIVGSAIDVTAAMTIVGPDADNYQLQQPDLTGEILARPEIQSVTTDDDPEFYAGDPLTVTVCNLAPGSDATATIDDSVVGSFPVDDEGCVEATVSLPTDLEPGSHDLAIRGADLAGGNAVVEVGFEVEAESVFDSLPFTGADMAASLGVGFLFLFGGAIVLGLSRFDARLARRFGA